MAFAPEWRQTLSDIFMTSCHSAYTGLDRMGAKWRVSMRDEEGMLAIKSIFDQYGIKYEVGKDIEGNVEFNGIRDNQPEHFMETMKIFDELSQRMEKRNNQMLKYQRTARFQKAGHSLEDSMVRDAAITNMIHGQGKS